MKDEVEALVNSILKERLLGTSLSNALKKVSNYIVYINEEIVKRIDNK